MSLSAHESLIPSPKSQFRSAMALFASVSRLPVHGRYSPVRGGELGQTWIAGLALCSGVTDWEPAAAQPPDRPVVRVLMVDGAAVPAETSERAQNDATACSSSRASPCVWLTPRRVSSLSDRPDRHAACEREEPQSAHARCRAQHERGARNKRVRSSTSASNLQREPSHASTSQLLGHVMAHELGHLLLPYGAHVVAGVMRPEWDRAQVKNAAKGLLTFTPDQAALIRERLQASASPIPDAR